MRDTIYRDAAINAANRADYRGFTVEDVKKVTDEVVKEIKKLPSAQSDNGYSDGFTDGYKRGLTDAQPDNQINLCDSCDYSYPDCPSESDDVIFGNGTGNDNICACNKYKPSAQPEQHTCVNCGRTANNGGWYADGGTRCPIEEHYALPKDGYCHLWEERNITDDDYPERREE